MKLTHIAQAVSGVLAVAVWSQGASAGLIDTQSAAFNNAWSKTHTWSSAGGNTTAAEAKTNTTLVKRFDPSLGVLTQARGIMTGAARNQSLSGGGSGGTGTLTKLAYGGGTANSFQLSFAGSSVGAGTNVSVPSSPLGSGNSCTTGGASCNYGPTSVTNSATNPSTAWVTTNLNNYVGTATNVAVTQSASMTVTSGNNTTAPFNTTATYQVNWSGNVGVSYDYVLHAQASFDANTVQNVKNIDFGTWLNQGPSSTQSFEIDNFDKTGGTPDNQSSMSLLNSSSSGDLVQLYADPVTTGGMPAGGAESYNAYFDSGQGLGHFTSQYVYQFGDAQSTSATDSLYSYQTAGQADNYTLTLNLQGSILGEGEASFSGTALQDKYLLDFGYHEDGAPVQGVYDIFNRLIQAAADQQISIKFMGCTASSGDVGSFEIELCGSSTPDVKIKADDFYASTQNWFDPTAKHKRADASYTLWFKSYEPTCGNCTDATDQYITLNVTGIPEPTSIALLGAGLMSFGFRRRQQI